jgi:hypothetical protein
MEYSRERLFIQIKGKGVELVIQIKGKGVDIDDLARLISEKGLEVLERVLKEQPNSFFRCMRPNFSDCSIQNRVIPGGVLEIRQQIECLTRTKTNEGKTCWCDYLVKYGRTKENYSPPVT